MSDPKRLLGGYATDSLTEAEREELLRAALEDQELFDSLVEDEGLRELLETPGARQQVLEALEQPTGWEQFRAWLTRPAVVRDLVVVASALLLGTMVLRIYRTPDTSGGGRPAARPSAAAVPPETLARLYARPPQAPILAGLEPETPVSERPWRVAAGETLAVRATLQAPAWILVVGEGPGDSAAQVFPPSGRPPLLVERPVDGGPGIVHLEVSASSVPGEHRLRLVVAPPDSTLDVAEPDVNALAPRLSLVDLVYEVTGPGTVGQDSR